MEALHKPTYLDHSSLIGILHFFHTRIHNLINCCLIRIMLCNLIHLIPSPPNLEVIQMVVVRLGFYWRLHLKEKRFHLTNLKYFPTIDLIVMDHLHIFQYRDCNSLIGIPNRLCKCLDFLLSRCLEMLKVMLA